jgi:hypothetical protein
MFKLRRLHYMKFENQCVKLYDTNLATSNVNTNKFCRKGKNVKLSLCFTWAPRHEVVLGEWRYRSTHSWSFAVARRCIISELDTKLLSFSQPIYTHKWRWADNEYIHTYIHTYIHIFCNYYIWAGPRRKQWTEQPVPQVNTVHDLYHKFSMNMFTPTDTTEQNSCFVFGRSRLQFSVRIPATFIDVFCGFYFQFL